MREGRCAEGSINWYGELETRKNPHCGQAGLSETGLSTDPLSVAAWAGSEGEGEGERARVRGALWTSRGVYGKEGRAH